MPFNRTRSRVAIGLLAFLLAAPSFGQGPQGMQLFEQADCSTMGGDIAPNEGWFFSFDALYWAVSPPKATQIGFPNLTREVFVGPVVNPVPNPGAGGGITNEVPTQISQERTDSNTLNTGGQPAQFSWGNRFEFGRIEDRNGWFVSIYQIRDQEQDLVFPSANIVFQDADFGPVNMKHLQGGLSLVGPSGNLPVTVFNISTNHSTDTWGVEVMFLHRLMTCHEGSTFELFAGPRYLEFNDNFNVALGAGQAGINIPDFLAGSSWNSSAQNHVIGGELGGRWFKKQGRWMLSTEGRFLAGLNCQNIHQLVNFGPGLNPGPPGLIGNTLQPLVMGPTTSVYDAAPREWTPGVELRIEARYQITRCFSFHAGWTGLWLDGIARGDAVIDYTLHESGQVMGIDLTRNRESLFMNGLTLGFDFNR